MDVLPSRLDGPLLLAPRVFGDERGFFCETYRDSELALVGIDDRFVQDNHSRSHRGVARGIHFHIGDGCAKLVRCGRGEIVDIVVDLRRDSPTYAEWEAFALGDENMHQLYVPIGFGHGFCVLSDVADVLYKQTRHYDPAIERGISMFDPDVAIDWPLPTEDLVYSERDASAPLLREMAPDLPF